MKSMVVTFDPTGEVHHTLKDSFLNVGEILGAKKSIHRMTTIEFDEAHQKFFIQFLRGKFTRGIETLSLAGHVVSENLVDEIRVGSGMRVDHKGSSDPEALDVIFFDSYEDAVNCEIELVNALRTLGAVF